MRDRPFIAVHHGGPLDLARHRLLALWAAGCAERVLHLFEQLHADDRPRLAIEAARAWGDGCLATTNAQRAAMAAHRAAREATAAACEAAARAAGHAVATGHMAEHAPGSAIYALRAVAEAGGDVESERAWQLATLHPAVRTMVEEELARRANGQAGRSQTPRMEAIAAARAQLSSMTWTSTGRATTRT